MFLKESLLSLFKENEVTKEIIKASNRVGNLFDMEEALLIASAFQQDHKTRILVKKNKYQAQQCYKRLAPLLDNVLLFVVEESLRVQAIASSPEDKQEMISTLTKCLMEPQEKIIICNTAAFLRFLPHVDVFRKRCIQLETDMEMDMDTLKKHLVQAGYVKVNYVDRPCTFASRGGIIDVFTLQYENPIRIEFFDTEIESIRMFDENTQRTIRTIDHCMIGPATDLLFSESQIEEIEKNVQEKLQIEIKKHSDYENEILTEHVENDMLALKNYNGDAFLYWYYPYTTCSSLLDYVQGQVIFSSIEEIQRAARDLNTDTIAFMQEMVKELRCLPKYILLHDLQKMAEQGMHIHEFLDFEHPVTSGIYPIERAVYPLAQQLQAIPFSQVYFSLEKESVHQLVPYLTDCSFSYKIIDPCFYEGFSFQDTGIYTEKELFTKKVERKRFKKTFKQGQVLESVLELNVHDYVVHEQYGIGQYMGIVTRHQNDQTLDYLHVIYAGGDDLFVPLSQFQLVRKYVSKEGVGIQLSKLGTDQWKKTKERVSKRVEEIAQRLVELYALRNENIGYAYPKDDALQREFEDAFEYDSTLDQIEAVREIKEEMEKPKPMDHLLCGDVGFGKTEVALRCAFKVVLAGKQVAFLCPTTILSMQHYQTVVQRMEPFGVRCALVNRFVSSKEIKKIKEDLKNGQIDIIIGTHKLLNATFVYKDLGFLIIDEEQRFGVTHKEKIKEMKKSIDVLSLSATPIPRTLQMSLIGVRTISQLKTAPAQRQPIQTYVMEKREGIIKEIIQRELSRDGQVFYLYNNISNIYSVANKIQDLFPDVQVAVAHGRMTKAEIEQTMLDYAQGVYQILVCTTIIETGLDIANANTIIIEQADHFGLSQLYQLRGRVGRRNRIAYCYLMIDKNHQITEQASKRLKSIKEFTQLGSGYKIAMRDLTIRGAGDLLGPQQAGFIDQVGLDLYLEMLAGAIQRQKGEKTTEPIEQKSANISLNGYVPRTFSDNDGDILLLYQEIKKVQSLEQLKEQEKKIRDLYGQIPKPVTQLLERRRIDLFANTPGVDTIEEDEHFLVLKMTKDWTYHCNGVKLFETINDISRKIQLRMTKGQIEIKILKSANRYDLLMKIIHEIQNNGEIYAT